MKHIIYQTIEKQKGAALIVLVLAFIMATSVLVISNYSIDRGKIAYEKRTTEALALAKEALVSYAVTFHDNNAAGLMGFLPCPEFTSSPTEGESIGTNCGNQYDSYLGRFPWKSLGVKPIKDGSGNCLWYAVSGDYKNNIGYDRNNLNQASGMSRSEMLNQDSNGAFRIFDENLNVIDGQTPGSRVLAVIIAPGNPVTGQSRAFTAGTQCGGDFDSSHFLELFNTKDNRSISTGVGHLIDEFIASSNGFDSTFNDRIITISQDDIWDGIRKGSSFNVLMKDTTQALAACIAQFGLNNPPVAGGCDLAICLQQCADDQTLCYDMCDACFNQCDLDYDACIAAGTKPKTCNKARSNCNKACPKLNKCRKACDTVFNACETTCNTSCVPGGGGGNDFRLPWPAAMDLSGIGEGYRDSQVYIEDNLSGNHLGRFPVDVNITDGVTGNSGGQYLIENVYCNPVNTDIGPVNLNTNAAGNSTQRRIWENWKDHFFYAVAGDYDSSNASTPALGACTNCLQSNSAGSYAGIVIFSGQRVAGQVRDMQPDANTKDVIGNYLEGNNNDINLDPTGNGNYQVLKDNDIAYCINEILDITTADPTDTTFEVIDCTGP